MSPPPTWEWRAGWGPLKSSLGCHMMVVITYMNPSKFNGKFVYGGNFSKKCWIYEVKCTRRGAIYIGNTQQCQRKEWMFISLISKFCYNWHKSDSFSAHYGQHFKSTMSLTDLHKYMAFKLFIQINPIGSMRSFMKPYCNLCMEELLSIIKKLYDKKCHTTEQKIGNIWSLPA